MRRAGNVPRYRMLVEYVWPQCDSLGGYSEQNGPVDLFWVECRPAEAERILSLRRHDTGKPLYPPLPSWRHPSNAEVWQFFLVSRDLRYVESTPRLYPFSPQWDRNNPFQRLKEPMEICTLDALLELEVP